MINIECAHNLEWDYEGWKEASTIPITNLYTQNDWNQTLITKVNQTSAMIFKSTLRGGASFMMANNKIVKIIKDSAFWREEEGMLAGRFTVIVNDLIHDDVLYVFSKELYQNPNKILVPLTFEYSDVLKDASFDEMFSKTHFKLAQYVPEDELINHKKRLIGKINILNYKTGVLI